MAQIFENEGEEREANRMVEVQHELNDIESLITEVKNRKQDQIAFSEDELLGAFNFQDGTEERKYKVIDDQKKYNGDIAIISKEQLNELIRYTMAYQEILNRSKEDYFTKLDNRVNNSFGK